MRIRGRSVVWGHFHDLHRHKLVQNSFILLTMRRVFDFQACLDTVPIAEIELDPTSRDVIIKFLYAMQQIFLDDPTRAHNIH